MNKDLVISSFGGAFLGVVISNIIIYAFSSPTQPALISHDGEIEPVNSIHVMRHDNHTNNPFTDCLDKIADQIVVDNETDISPSTAARVKAGVVN